MPRRRTPGCLGVIAIGAILYSCATSMMNISPSSTPTTIENLQAITKQERSGSQVILATSTQESQVSNSQTSVEVVQPVIAALTENTSPATTWGIVTANVLNVRAAPNASAGILGTLIAGECVELIKEEDGWYGIKGGGDEGWSSAEYIAQVTVCPTPAPIPQSVEVISTPVQATVVPVNLPPVPPTAIPPTAVFIPPTATPASRSDGCDPNYQGACIPQVGYDLDCPEVGVKNFYSVGSDPHGFDRDNDGLACES